MTHRIDRLVARDLVVRHRDPADRRGVLVQLTDTGLARVDAALADLLARERDLLGDLAETERRDLSALLRRLVAPFDG